MHLGRCSTFGKRKNTLACGSSIFTLSESLATSLLNGKPFGIPLIALEIAKNQFKCKRALIGTLFIREVKIGVYGRPVTANGKLQFAFEGKFYKFRKVSTSFLSIHSSILMHKLS